MTAKFIQLLRWRPEYSVGNAKLDRQHQQLLSLCIEAHDLIRLDGRQSGGRLDRVLNDLWAYASFHFHAEEAFLESIGFPDIEAHLAEHENYREKLANTLVDTLNGTLSHEGLLDYLSYWWINHILGSDMRYAQHHQSKAGMALAANC